MRFVATKKKAPSVQRAKQVLIVDDHPIVRQGLAQLVDQTTDLHVCGQIERANEVMAAIKQFQPDVMLIDLNLGGTTGLDLIEEIKVHYAKLPILVLSMHDESVYAERALKSGACGYAMKDTPTEQLLGAIRRVLSGEIYVSEKMAGRLLQKMAFGAGSTALSPAATLSNRELQIFELIGQGLGTRQIAEKLHLSSKTIDTHRENIKRKLNLDNSVELHQHAFAWTHLGENPQT
jgi:DNA-binding NarL/FixJ family response regulator